MIQNHQRNNTCGRCALRTQDLAHCALTNREINPETDFCSQFSSTAHVCEICGSIIIDSSGEVIDITDSPHLICLDCFKKLKSCALCGDGAKCAFEQDPNPLPKAVPQTVRRGNMIMQTQVKNPARIKALCPTCSCWSNNQCQKENNYCEKHYHNY